MNEGISFIVRCRNEKKYLKQSLSTLSKLNIPYEINLILHLCDDECKEIANELKKELNVNIFEYNREVSRSGYETYITPQDHNNSFITYSRFCFDTAACKWKFRWDVDFFATPELINFINNLNLDTSEKIKYRIPCQLGDTGILNEEIYLSNCMVGITKYIFWEIYNYEIGSIEVNLTDTCKINSLSYKEVKDYWNDDVPWFIKDRDQTLSNEYYKLVKNWGPEPVGMARASNPEANRYIKLACNV
jgi:hypothetical protein